MKELGEFLVEMVRADAMPKADLLSAHTVPEVLATVVRHPAMGLMPQLAVVVTYWKATGLHSDRSLAAALDTGSRFTSYADRSGAERLADIDHSLVARFVEALTPAGAVPSPYAQRQRLTVTRLVFRTAILLGMVEADPTAGVASPTLPGISWRPLSDDEVVLCRLASVPTLGSTRQPAGWALAEALATPTELGHIKVEHVSDQAALVWSPGSNVTRPRWLHLTDWGSKLVRARLNDLRTFARQHRRRFEDLFVTWTNEQGSPTGGRTSSNTMINQIIRRAGVDSRHVTAKSVRAWRARQLFDDGVDLLTIANRLGVRSLEQAADIIGHKWQIDDSPDTPPSL